MNRQVAILGLAFLLIISGQCQAQDERLVHPIDMNLIAEHKDAVKHELTLTKYGTTALQVAIASTALYMGWKELYKWYTYEPRETVTISYAKANALEVLLNQKVPSYFNVDYWIQFSAKQFQSLLVNGIVLWPFQKMMKKQFSRIFHENTLAWYIEKHIPTLQFQEHVSSFLSGIFIDEKQPKVERSSQFFELEQLAVLFDKQRKENGINEALCNQILDSVNDLIGAVEKIIGFVQYQQDMAEHNDEVRYAQRFGKKVAYLLHITETFIADVNASLRLHEETMEVRRLAVIVTTFESDFTTALVGVQNIEGLCSFLSE